MSAAEIAAAMATTPAMTASAGEVTNFDVGMTEIQRKFIVVYAGTLAGATVCLMMRLWTRIQTIRGMWIDDYAIIAAWLVDIGFFIAGVNWMKYGLGDHLWNVSLEQLVEYGQNATLIVTLYCWAPMLTEFSLLVL